MHTVADAGKTRLRDSAATPALSPTTATDPELAVFTPSALQAATAPALLVMAALLTGAASAEPIDPSAIHVIDGDTIGLSFRDENTRLVGFNAPESRNADCESERRLGGAATARLRAIIAAGNLDLQFVRCSCRPGTELTPACNFGRSCAVLRSAGRDVGDILIEEGLAVAFQCGPTSCPTTPRPWCN